MALNHSIQRTVASSLVHLEFVREWTLAPALMLGVI